MPEFRMRNRSDQDNPRLPWVVAVELNRLLAVLLVFSWGLIGFLVIWHQTNPVTVKEPVYVEFQTGGNNFVVLQRGGEGITSNEALIDREARRYVALREPIDRITEMQRFPNVMGMSSDRVGKEFKLRYGGKDGLLSRDGLKREIVLGPSRRLAAGVHQVEFKMRTWTHGDKAPEGLAWDAWTATMAYEFESKEIRMDDKVQNPMGWVTTEYTVTKGAGQW